jgi:uroporphyrinogen-III synthase
MTAVRRPAVALPETRHLDVLANLLERRGVDVIRCPLVAIRDASGSEAVVAWIDRLSAGDMNLLIVYTGEGLERLEGFAERAGIRERFVAALASTPLLTRGPKPARVLRRFGVRPEYPALAPTTDGIIETLRGIDIAGWRIGIQLYGAETLPSLIKYLESRGAMPDPVAPYVYASESDDQAVAALIDEIRGGRVDAIAFTSKTQVERLARVAADRDSGSLSTLLEPLVVAAVGPVVAAELGSSGVHVDVVPESEFFMKPMVTALMSRLGLANGDG